MIGASAGVLLMVATLYVLFQSSPVYLNTLGKITQNYRNDGQRIYKDHVPYEKFSEEKMYRWDGSIYRKMADNGYDLKAAGGDYIFAFFPLFPLLWKLSGLNATQIALLNYLFYVISLIILVCLFKGNEAKQKWRHIMVLAGIPMMMVFLIPYTEGLFMLTSTLAIWGLMKKRYGLYFFGALLASMTRQSVSILVLTFLFTEFYFLVRHGQLSKTLKSFAEKTLPLLTGSAFVSGIQYAYGSGHPIKFLLVEKYWGFMLQWPGALTDWAHEQFCTNLPLLVMVLPVLLSFLVIGTTRNLFRKKSTETNAGIIQPDCDNREYLYILSSVYIVGMCLTILVLKGGSLNGLSRFVFCTPFYPVTLFMLNCKISRLALNSRAVFFISAFILSFAAFSLTDYSKSWNFSDLGFFLFFFQIAFFIFTNLITRSWIVIAFSFLSALWTSYLFSMYISNAWLVT